MSQKQEINRFSEESQQLLEDMNQTEIFELCENSSKIQCPDCNPFTEIGIINCSCGRNLKYKRSPTSTQKAHGEYTSISLALSLRRILLEDQSTAILNDKSCSSRQRRCLRKQHSQNTGTIQRFLHDDMQKKDTEIRWRSTILAKKKLCFTIASLLNDMIAQLHELNGYRTPNIGFFV